MKPLCRQKADTNEDENPPSSPFVKGGKGGDLKKRDFQVKPNWRRIILGILVLASAGMFLSL